MATDLLAAALEAEGADATLASLFRSLYQQESSSGSNTTTSNRGATGGSQILPATFNEVADPGWTIKNPYQNLRAGIRYARQGLEAAGGDPSLAAAYYYGGPTGLAKAQQGIAVSDPKNPKAPNTLQYAQQVVNRMSSPSSEADEIDSFMKGLKEQGTAESQFNTGDTNVDGVLKFMTDYEDKKLSKIAAPMTQQGQSSAPAATEDKRTFGQKAGRVAAELVGGAAGGAMGTAVGGPIGGVAGMAAGSAAGSALASTTFDPVESPGQEAVMAGGASLIGSGIGAALGKVLSSAPAREGGEALLKIARKAGLTPTPAQYFDNSFLRTIESFGSAHMDEAHAAAIQSVRTAATQYAEKTAAAKEPGALLMDKVLESTSNLRIKLDLRETENIVATLAQKYPGNPEIQNIYKRIAELPNPARVPFDVSDPAAIAARAQALKMGPNAYPVITGAQDIRSDLARVIRTSTDSKEKRLAVTAMESLDAKMTAALAPHPDVAAAWKIGRDLYKEGSQGEILQTILSKASVSGGESGDIGGKALANAVKDHRREITQLTPLQVQNLEIFSKALQAGEAAGQSAFQFIGRGLEMRAIMRIGQGVAGGVGVTEQLRGNQGSGAQLGAIAVVLSPYAISRIFASPTTFKLMLGMSRMPESVKQAGTVGNQLLLQMLNEHIITPDDIIKPGAAQQ